MSIGLTVVACTAYFATLARLLTYRRDGARYQRHVSWVAWVAVAITGCSAIKLALYVEPVTILEVASAVLLAVFVFGARGNVARLLRSK